jgi:UDP-N-acetylmuramoyl-L-alanyl-D-glutamate--2,6-diaminopimelate ligase
MNSNATMVSIDSILTWLSAFAGAQLSSDSRTICPGDVFVAYPGDEADGRRYIADAIARGAVAVIYEQQDYTWTQDAAIPHLGVTGLKGMAGHIASAYYAFPDRKLLTVAVTGTNGKTSSAYWIGAALSRLHANPSAVIGTLGVGLFEKGVAQDFEVTGYTTPDAVLLQRKLTGVCEQGAKSLAIEASSIGLDQGRMNGLHVDVAMFTNLTRDHLDYHHDMAAYEASKRALFDWPGLQLAIINIDDAAGQRMAAHTLGRGVRVIAYTLGDAVVAGADLLRASNIKSHAAGTTFQVDSPFGAGLVKTHLVGQFNVSNVLGVLALLLSQGATWDVAVNIVGLLTPVPGRMQQIGGVDAPLIVIDYAHTPDALQKTLEALRPVAEQRGGALWCMFGCGGDRDSGKRAEMGRVAELADKVILTSDNPRSEDPMAIITQIQSGMQTQEPQIQVDRAAAILWAVRFAGKQDVVLLAGKGHEAYQDVGGKKKPFLDADHAALAFAARATKMGGLV